MQHLAQCGYLETRDDLGSFLVCFEDLYFRVRMRHSHSLAFKPLPKLTLVSERLICPISVLTANHMSMLTPREAAKYNPTTSLWSTEIADVWMTTTAIKILVHISPESF